MRTPLSLYRTLYNVPKVSTIERFHCIVCVGGCGCGWGDHDGTLSKQSAKLLVGATYGSYREKSI